MNFTEAEVALCIILHFEFSLLNQYVAKPSYKLCLGILLLKCKIRVPDAFIMLQVVFS